MRIFISTRAKNDLLTIGDYIALDNRSRARSFSVELRQACYELAKNPERFALLAGHENIGVRRRVHGNYLIVYRVNNKGIEILRIVHGAMDLDKVLS